MKRFVQLMLFGGMFLIVTGCGSAGPETDEKGNQEAKSLAEDPDYAKQMEGKGK